MSFFTDADEITAIAGAAMAETNEEGELPGGIVGFFLDWVQQDC